MTEATAAPTTADLARDRTVPKSIVHKRAIEQVFVTDYMRGPEPDICTIAAELPIAHARFSDSAAPYHDIVGLAEIVRQGGLVSATHVLEIPDDRQFLLRELSVELDPLEANRRGPDRQHLTIAQDPNSAIKVRPRGIAGGLMRSRLYIEGEPSGSCSVMGVWVQDEMYGSFRGSKANGDGNGQVHEPLWLEPDEREQLTGRSPRNVVIGPLRDGDGDGDGDDGDRDGARSAALVVDRSDPTFFDHELDHVPGLLLMEAMQQAAIASTCAARDVPPERVVMRSLKMTFSRIAEFAPEVTVGVRLSEDGSSAEVECAQLGKTCCAGTAGIAIV